MLYRQVYLQIVHGDVVIIKIGGSGSVGRAVASYSRGPRLESSHRQKFILNIYCQLYWKYENREKMPVMAHLKK